MSDEVPSLHKLVVHQRVHTALLKHGAQYGKLACRLVAPALARKDVAKSRSMVWVTHSGCS